MTKYVLNSGAVRNYPDKNRAFLAEIVSGLGASPRILIVPFAQPREDWETRFSQYETEMNSFMPHGVTATFALGHPDSLEEQVNACDVIYIPGGDDDLIEYRFGKFDLPKLFEGKVVGGSSAGSDFLAKHYWTCDWRTCRDGLGVLQVKFLPHFNSAYGNDDSYRGPIDWQMAHKELAAYGDTSLPIHALEEGDFITITQ